MTYKFTLSIGVLLGILFLVVGCREPATATTGEVWQVLRQSDGSIQLYRVDGSGQMDGRSEVWSSHTATYIYDQGAVIEAEYLLPDGTRQRLVEDGTGVLRKAAP